jgi:glycosyltransferase involved in cell wall biosynthesis
MDISVLVPTYHRPQDLLRCLNALALQTKAPFEVLVVVRDTDTETFAALANFKTDTLPLKTLVVQEPGQVAALNTGLSRAQGEVIAITDDDAAPRPQWLERIDAHFAGDHTVGGVGGKDIIHPQSLVAGDSPSTVVGKVQWFGRVIGRHHLGFGEPRPVSVLKGANMSYRQAAVDDHRFDTRLRGQGAQVHNDMAFSLAIKRAGWQLMYDPLVEVDHYPAQRFDEDQRDAFSYEACKNAVHNETVALLDYLPWVQKAIFMVWALVVGTRDAFGLVQWLRFSLKGDGRASERLAAAWQGRLMGLQTWGRYRLAKSSRQSESLGPGKDVPISD